MSVQWDARWRNMSTFSGIWNSMSLFYAFLMFVQTMIHSFYFYIIILFPINNWQPCLTFLIHDNSEQHHCNNTGSNEVISHGNFSVEEKRMHVHIFVHWLLSRSSHQLLWPALWKHQDWVVNRSAGKFQLKQLCFSHHAEMASSIQKCSPYFCQQWR